MLPANEMLNRFLNSPLANDVKNKDEFKQFTMFNLKYNVMEKNKHEHDIDIIVSKRMLEHIKEFFDKDEPIMKLKAYNKHQKSFKKNNNGNGNNTSNNTSNNNNNNKTLKKKK
jgi:hypothetical protein